MAIWSVKVERVSFFYGKSQSLGRCVSLRLRGLIFFAGVTKLSLSLEHFIATVKIGIDAVTMLIRDGRRRNAVS